MDPKTGITPPSSPHDFPRARLMNQEIHFDVESFHPFESKFEGIVKTLEKGYLGPSNPPLTDMNSLVIVELPTQAYFLLHQRCLPHIEEHTTESLKFPSTSQNVSFLMENLTIVNNQPADLP